MAEPPNLITCTTSQRAPARGFGDVDHAARPAMLLEYLALVSGLPAIQTYKRASIQILELQAGDRVLDVGCGTGEDARAMLNLVGTSGLVVGLDASQQMLAAARARHARMGPQLRFELGDAQQLPFEDGTFDACHAERVLQHLENPGTAIAEMVRATRPGGRLVISEPDWGTLVLDAQHLSVTDRILAVHHARIAHPWIGRQLRRLLIECQLADVTAITHTLVMEQLALAEVVLGLGEAVAQAVCTGVVPQEQAEAWTAALRRQDQTGQFFAAGTMFTVSGSRRATTSTKGGNGS